MRNGRVRGDAIDRARMAAQAYARFCRTVGIDHIEVVATSAIREAANQDEILAAIGGPEGLPVRVISTEQEARYAFLGAINSTTLANGAVLDIGGGSMQLSRVSERAQTDFVSLPLGAVRATEDFLRSDPPRKRELTALRKAVRSELKGLKWLPESTTHLVGVGGSIRTLGAMDQRRREYPMREIQGYRLTRDALGELIAQMRSVTAKKRAGIPGLKRDRADILLGGAVVIDEVMDCVGARRLEVSSAGLREGVYYDGLTTLGASPILASVRRATVLGLTEGLGADVVHAEQVWRLAEILYRRLCALDLQEDDPGERELLWAAAMLHDVGVLIDYHDHHKHSEYLVLNAGLPGFNHRELAIIAALVRGHRKRPADLRRFARVTRPADRTSLDRLAVCLRLAEQLERGRSHSIVDIRAGRSNGALHLEIVSDGDAGLGTWAASQEEDCVARAFDLGLRISRSG